MAYESALSFQEVKGLTEKYIMAMEENLLTCTISSPLLLLSYASP